MSHEKISFLNTVYYHYFLLNKGVGKQEKILIILNRFLTKDINWHKIKQYEIQNQNTGRAEYMMVTL